MSYYLWKQWQINLSSVTIFRYPKQVQVSLKELNFRLKERKTVGSGQGFVPPQHLWPRLRGVFFPRDKSGPACHMSTIHPPSPSPKSVFRFFARAADGHASSPSSRSGNPRRASRRISCGGRSPPQRDRKIYVAFEWATKSQPLDRSGGARQFSPSMAFVKRRKIFKDIWNGVLRYVFIAARLWI